MAVEDDLVALVEQQEEQATSLLEAALAALSAPLTGFQGWYSYRATNPLLQVLGGLLGGFQAVAARNADAYMAQAITIATGRTFRPVGIRRTLLGRYGVDNPTVLGRVMDAYRYQQSQVDRTLLESVRTGTLLELPVEPLQAAQERLETIVETDLQTTARSQQQATLRASQTRVTGYRRIIHPELATTGTCGLCIAASDRIYSVGTLLPIHPGCHCTVLPITGKIDTGVINEVDLRQLYRQAGGTDAALLRQTRYRVDEHGELGPILAPADQPIRTERQAAKARKTVEQREQTLERKRRLMTGDLESFRARRQTEPEKFGTPEWDAVETALANRIEDLAEAA